MAVAQKTPSADTKPVADFSKEQELSAYRTMLTIRRFEEKAGQMYGMGLIGGFCHLYIGQEAVVVGMQMVLKDGDQVITGYRDHGHMLATGMEAKGVMAELTGRAHGYSKGKGGSMHMFSVEKGFYGGHGIVARRCRSAPGSPLPITTAATTMSPHLFRRRRGQSGSSLRELQHGGALEAAGHLRDREQSLRHGDLDHAVLGEDNLSRRGLSFNIPGEQVDGMDVRAVKAAGEKAAQWCRAGKGPYILEMLTYRYRGHSMSDPAKYRTREEVDEDPHAPRSDRAWRASACWRRNLPARTR